MFLGCSMCSYVVPGLFLGCSACSWLVLGMFRLCRGVPSFRNDGKFPPFPWSYDPKQGVNQNKHTLGRGLRYQHSYFCGKEGHMTNQGFKKQNQGNYAKKDQGSIYKETVGTALCRTNWNFLEPFSILKHQ